ncbi:putative membrane protein [Streptomyces sp. SAI-170]
MTEAMNTNRRGTTTNRTTATMILGAATVTTGLMAGTFFIFACAVMPALSRSDDRVFVQVMRDINDVIQNPLFLSAFMGALLLCALAAWQSRTAPHRWWTWTACAAYALTFLLTMAGNIPLNDQLASTTASATSAREHFEDAWVAWNAARAVLSTVALALLTGALLRRGRPAPARSADADAATV